MHRSAFCVVLTVILAASGASAQAAQPDQTELIKQLIQRIDKLEGEVTELKSALADATFRPEPISKPAPASSEIISITKISSFADAPGGSTTNAPVSSESIP